MKGKANLPGLNTGKAMTLKQKRRIEETSEQEDEFEFIQRMWYGQDGMGWGKAEKGERHECRR